MEALYASGWNVERAADEVIPGLCYLDKSFDADDFYENRTGAYEDRAIEEAIQASMMMTMQEEEEGEPGPTLQPTSITAAPTLSELARPQPEVASSLQAAGLLLPAAKRTAAAVPKPNKLNKLLSTKPTTKHKTSGVPKRAVAKALPAASSSKLLKPKRKPVDKGALKPKLASRGASERGAAGAGMGKELAGTLGRISNRRSRVEALEAARRRAEEEERERERKGEEGKAAAEAYCDHLMGLARVEDSPHLRVDLLGSPNTKEFKPPPPPEQEQAAGPVLSDFRAIFQQAPLVEEEIRAEEERACELARLERERQEERRREAQRKHQLEAEARAEAERLERAAEAAAAVAAAAALAREEEKEKERRRQEAEFEAAKAKAAAEEAARNEAELIEARAKAVGVLQALSRGHQARLTSLNDLKAAEGRERLVQQAARRLQAAFTSSESRRTVWQASMAAKRIKAGVRGWMARRAIPEEASRQQTAAGGQLHGVLVAHQARDEVRKRMEEERLVAGRRLQALVRARKAKVEVGAGLLLEEEERRRKAAMERIRLQQADKVRIEKAEFLEKERVEKDRLAKLQREEKEKLEERLAIEEEGHQAARRKREAAERGKREAAARAAVAVIPPTGEGKGKENRSGSRVLGKVQEARRKAAEAMEREEKLKTQAAEALRSKGGISLTTDKIERMVRRGSFVETTGNATTTTTTVKRMSSTGELRATEMEYTKVLPKRGFSTQPRHLPHPDPPPAANETPKPLSRNKDRPGSGKMPSIAGGSSQRGVVVTGHKRGLTESSNIASNIAPRAIEEANRAAEASTCHTDVRTSKLSASKLLIRMQGNNVSGANKKRGVRRGSI